MLLRLLRTVLSLLVSLVLSVVTLLLLPSTAHAAEPDPAFVRTVGAAGAGDGQLDSPRGIAVDASGNLFVADEANNRIQVFSPSGAFVRQWGTQGTANGQLWTPDEVEIDPSGNVWVSDAGNQRIQKFTSTGTHLLTFGSYGDANGQFQGVGDLAFDPNGNLYLTDYQGHRVQKFDSAGTFVSTFGSEGTGIGQFSYPEGIDIDAAGNIYVTDAVNYRVQKFSSAGTFITTWGSQATGPPAAGQFSSYPKVVSVDPAGNVWVADSDSHRIQKFTNTGTPLLDWQPAGAGTGKFFFPYGLDFSATEMFVSDTGNNRVQVYTASAAPANAAPAITEASPAISTAPRKSGSVTLNATDADNDALTWSVSTEPSYGDVTFAAGSGLSKTFTYTAEPGYGAGQDSFTAQVSDGKGGVDTVVVTVTVAKNAGPTVTPADYTKNVAPGGSVTFEFTATDPNDDPLTWSVYTAPTEGTVTFPDGTAAAKTFTYTANADATSFDTFNVKVTDGFNSVFRTVDVFIQSGTPNTAPVIAEASPAVAVTAPAAGSVTLNATDADSDPLTWAVQTQGTKGTATVPSGTGGSKVITYAPNAGASGADSFVVVVSDGKGGTDTVTVKVTITAATTTPPTTTPTPITNLAVSASGGTRVGEVRVAKTSYDGDTSVALNYQWQHAGKSGTWVNIAGATARELDLPPSVMKINVRVVVTASRAGASAVSASAPLLILPGNHDASKLKIKGQPQVGKKLRATVKIPDKAAGLKITYLWTVAGTTLRLEGKSITVPVKAAGKEIFVDIRITAPGYHNQQLRSTKVKIK